MPKFRRFGGYGAYAEGWGLYAERLGQGDGLLPRSLFASSACFRPELWRAVRLVVDTGLHTKRWTREQAIDYFQANGLLSRARLVKEVERYINNPGQATSYKIGQLKILELRERARRGARATASTSAISTPRCWRTARCRSTCSKSRSTPGSRKEGIR